MNFSSASPQDWSDSSTGTRDTGGSGAGLYTCTAMLRARVLELALTTERYNVHE